MDFIKILRALEEALYEIVTWLATATFMVELLVEFLVVLMLGLASLLTVLAQSAK